MAICNNCGKEVEAAIYSRGKYYCEDCYREARKAIQQAQQILINPQPFIQLASLSIPILITRIIYINNLKRSNTFANISESKGAAIHGIDVKTAQSIQQIITKRQRTLPQDVIPVSQLAFQDIWDQGSCLIFFLQPCHPYQLFFYTQVVLLDKRLSRFPHQDHTLIDNNHKETLDINHNAQYIFLLCRSRISIHPRTATSFTYPQPVHLSLKDRHSPQTEPQGVANFSSALIFNCSLYNEKAR